MKQILTLVTAALMSMTWLAPAHAADDKSGKTAEKAAEKADKTDKKALTPQQQRMSDCSKQSKGKSGDERKEFMSACLSGKSDEPVKTAQQQKMTTCNAEAKGKAGDERKAFMKECLSAK